MVSAKRVGIAVVAFLALGVLYYGVSPLFRNVRVDEAAPDTTSIATSSQSSTVSLESNASANASTSPGYRTAPVIGTPAHPASGTARIVVAGDTRYVRYEDFKTIKGPDIYVYLANDLSAKEFVSLGRVKATEGNVNYEIPASVDLENYRYVLTWCKAFGVLFNYADLVGL